MGHQKPLGLSFWDCFSSDTSNGVMHIIKTYHVGVILRSEIVWIPLNFLRFFLCPSVCLPKLRFAKNCLFTCFNENKIANTVKGLLEEKKMQYCRPHL